jgi:hypothetical protein
MGRNILLATASLGSLQERVFEERGCPSLTTAANVESLNSFLFKRMRKSALVSCGDVQKLSRNPVLSRGARNTEAPAMQEKGNHMSISKVMSGLGTVAAITLAQSAFAEGDGLFTVDISGWQTWGTFNGSNQAPNGNSRIDIDVSALAGIGSGQTILITGVGWDVNYEALGASWQSEVRVRFQWSTLNPPPAPPVGYNYAINLLLGGESAPGQWANASSIIKLANFGIPPVRLEDGMLHVQAFETFDNGGPDVQDALFGPGSVIIFQYQYIPAPSALTMLGMAGLVGTARRRRQ